MTEGRRGVVLLQTVGRAAARAGVARWVSIGPPVNAEVCVCVCSVTVTRQVCRRESVGQKCVIIGGREWEGARGARLFLKEKLAKSVRRVGFASSTHFFYTPPTRLPRTLS